MEANLIKIKIDDNSELLIATKSGQGRLVGGKNIGEVIVDKLVNTIKGYITVSYDAITSLNTEKKPDELSVEFGINISGEGNFYVATGIAEASIKVTATWKNLDI